MSAPVWKAKGAFTYGTGALSVPWPVSGYAVGDFALLVVETASQPVSTPSGWTFLDSSGHGTNSTGTPGAAGESALFAFYKFAASTAEADVAVADSGNHTIAQIHVYGNVHPTNPVNAWVYEITTVITTSPSTASADLIALYGNGTNIVVAGNSNATRDNGMLVTAFGTARASNTTDQFSNWYADTFAQTGTASHYFAATEDHDQSVAVGVGGGIGISHVYYPSGTLDPLAYDGYQWLFGQGSAQTTIAAGQYVTCLSLLIAGAQIISADITETASAQSVTSAALITAPQNASVSEVANSTHSQGVSLVAISSVGEEVAGTDTAAGAVAANLFCSESASPTDLFAGYVAQPATALDTVVASDVASAPAVISAVQASEHVVVTDFPATTSIMIAVVTDTVSAAEESAAGKVTYEIVSESASPIARASVYAVRLARNWERAHLTEEVRAFQTRFVSTVEACDAFDWADFIIDGELIQADEIVILQRAFQLFVLTKQACIEVPSK